MFWKSRQAASEPTTVVSLRFNVEQRLVDIEVPPPFSASPSVFAFSCHKSGSTMFFNVLSALSKDAGLTYFSIPDLLFKTGVGIQNVTPRVEMRPTGYCYAGFRTFPTFDIGTLDKSRAAILIRDPRDALVSAYYSTRESHKLPGEKGGARKLMLARREEAQAQDIDAWVLANSGGIQQTLAGYRAQRMFDRQNVAVYRYEDIIFRKREWVRDLVQWYGWDIADKKADAAADKVDIVPKSADPSKHIRQVKPGNYLTELREDTQAELTRRLERDIKLFGYDRMGATTASEAPLSP